jgi:hypothetical protein
MGLDMYAYVAVKEGQQRAFYESAEFDDDSKDFTSKTVEKPREIAYWRKHPNLHGWMEQLTWADLEILELDVIAGSLPGTSGFFFGNDADDHYREQDLKFIRDARAELFCGLKVFYNSSW